jgi:hypothetical protein
MFYFVQLPVFGQMGPKTEMDSTVHPPIVQKLHCLLDSIPKSELWRVFPCIIVGLDLAENLRRSGCSGFNIREAIFDPGDAFLHIHGKATRVPELHWCLITGTAYTDDLGLAEGSKLIVSERVKRLIETAQHDGIAFVGGDKPPTDEEIRQMIWADATKATEELKAKGKPRTGWFAPPES